MNCYEIQESGYTGQVWPSSSYPQQFYFYSVSRTPHREQLFDGVAGDIAEAVSTMFEMQENNTDVGFPPGLRVFDIDNGTDSFDLSVEARERDGGLDFRFGYNTDLFDHGRVPDAERTRGSGARRIVSDPYRVRWHARLSGA